MLREHLRKQAEHKGDLKDQLLTSLSAPIHAQRMAEIAAEFDARGRHKPLNVKNPTLYSTLYGLAGKGAGWLAAAYAISKMNMPKSGIVSKLTPGMMMGTSGVAGYYAASRLAKFIARHNAERELANIRDLPINKEDIDYKLKQLAAESRKANTALSVLWPEKGSYTQAYVRALKELRKKVPVSKNVPGQNLAQEILSSIPGGQLPQGIIGGLQEDKTREELQKEFPERLEKAAGGQP